MNITLTDLTEAHERIKPYIHRTPVLKSEGLNQIAGCEVYFKCENFQKVGAFKARGGMNAVLGLSQAERNRGITTHSSGNHAQAIALAAKLTHSKAYIVMPKNAPSVKVNAVKGYGAEVVFCENTLQAREDTVEKVIQETGACFVHPYNDQRIICGQATAALELFEELPTAPDFLLTPVGGGGLLSGSALAAHFLSPETTVIGTEPEGADDAYRSFHAGKLIPQVDPQTVADGLRTSLGSMTFGIIQEHVSDILLVNDEEIIEAMKLIWQRMKIIIEPSCAVPFAALLRNKEKFQGKSVAIILSGGNVDINITANGNQIQFE